MEFQFGQGGIVSNAQWKTVIITLLHVCPQSTNLAVSLPDIFLQNEEK